MTDVATRTDTLPADAKRIAELVNGEGGIAYQNAILDAMHRAGATMREQLEVLFRLTEVAVEVVDLVDGMRNAGQLATRGDNRFTLDVHGADIYTLKDLHLSRQRLLEWRALRDRGALDYLEDQLASVDDTLVDNVSLRRLIAALKATAAQNLVASDENEWYTPARYVEATRSTLGRIEFDPASCKAANEIVRADKFWTAKDDGLSKPWAGLTFMNPPYGRLAGDFVTRLCSEYEGGNVTAAIALVNAHCTDTSWFQSLWKYPVCFTDHRIDFVAVDREKSTTSTHGSAFAYLGPDTTRFIQEFHEFGPIVAALKP